MIFKDVASKVRQLVIAFAELAKSKRLQQIEAKYVKH